MRRSRIDQVDRISALPEPLQHHILSFLSLEDIIRASMLSKKWKQVWHTFPNLEFSTIRNDQRLMLKYLERTLLRRHMDMISIVRLALRVDMAFLYHPKFAIYISRCLCYAVGSNVRELILDLLFYRRSYILPQVVFHSRSLVVLELQGVKLESSRNSVKLSSLRNLCLSRVFANDGAIENLVAGCPSIDYLNVNACHGFKSLELSSVSKLKMFRICNECSELERLYVDGVTVHSIDMMLLPESCEINVTSCKTLKCLNLLTLSITDEWLCNLISKLPFLEYLDITRCMKLRSIKISSQCLKDLIISNCILVEVKIETPNLRTFKYKGNTVSLSLNALALSEVLLHLYCNDVDSEWFMKFIGFLAKFNQFSKVLHLQVDPGEAVIVPGKIRKILRPPLTCDKHVTHQIGHLYVKFPIIEVLDSLLWISPHADAVSIVFKYGCWNKFTLKFWYKAPLVYEGEIPRCCKSHTLLCWQHCIKKVEIEHSIMTFLGKIVDVKNYSVDSVENEHMTTKIIRLFRQMQ